MVNKKSCKSMLIEATETVAGQQTFRNSFRKENE